MFPLLHFHYEDILRQDLLLKLNYANVMEVPGFFEIRLVPKAGGSDFRIQFWKWATETLCGQKFIQKNRGLDFKAGKSFRSNPFLGSKKDTGSLSNFSRQSVVRGHGMFHFLLRILKIIYLLDYPVEIRENSMKFSMETEFLEFYPELEDQFEVFEHIQGFYVTIFTSANTKDETLLLWSGFLQDE
nr:ribosomal protein L5 [Isolepis setacea]